MHARQRRELEREGSHARVEAAREIAFVDLLFSKHPKIAEAWEHRKWCVRQYVCAGDPKAPAQADSAAGDQPSFSHMRLTCVNSWLADIPKITTLGAIVSTFAYILNRAGA